MTIEIYRRVLTRLWMEIVGRRNPFIPLPNESWERANAWYTRQIELGRALVLARTSVQTEDIAGQLIEQALDFIEKGQ